MAVTVTSSIAGGDKWQKFIEDKYLKLKSPDVRVGILHGATHSEDHQKKAVPKNISKGAKKQELQPKNGSKSLPKIVEIGFWQEFGTKKIPERSFLRSTQRDKQSKWLKEFAKLCKMMPIEQALDQMGGIMTADVRDTIKAGIAPALSAETLARREACDIAGTTPLMASRELISAISHEVTKK